MANLTQANRKTIVNRAIIAAYTPKKVAQDKAEAAQAMQCYNAVFPKKIREQASLMPAGWLRDDNCLRFNAMGYEAKLCMEEKVRVPSSNYGCQRLGNLEPELGQKVQEFLRDKEKMREEVTRSEHKLTGFLEQFKTFKQMQQAWPEGEQFYKDLNAERTPQQLPAVITSEINAMLGLDKKKGAK